MTSQRGSDVSVEILQVDIENKAVQLRISFYKGLYGDSILRGVVGDNGTIKASGYLFSLDGGGSFQMDASLKVESGTLTEGKYWIVPELGNPNIFQAGELLDLRQVSGEPIDLNF